MKILRAHIFLLLLIFHYSLLASNSNKHSIADFPYVAVVYDGNLVTEEIDLLDPNKKIIRSYTWGLDPAGTQQQVGGIGALVSMEETQPDNSVKTFHVVSDAGGNVTNLVESHDDGSLTMANTYEYGPFGQVVAKTEAVEMPYQFNTKYTDSETGLVYYGYRFYDSADGRWLNRDPIGAEGGINIYNSVSNNMVNGFSGGPKYSFGMEKYVGELGGDTGVDSWGHWKIILPTVDTAHEDLIDRGWKTIANKFWKKVKYNTRYYHEIIRGVRYPDIPANGGHTIGLGALAVIVEWKWIDGDKTITKRTHLGDLQYWHAMSDGKDTAKELRKKILTHLEKLFSEVWDVKNGISRKCPNLFPLGQALHTLQDSFSPSHVKRQVSGYKILSYQQYDVQDSKKHGKADTTHTIWYSFAENATKEVLQKLLIDRKTPKEIVKFLETKYFQHADGVTTKGSSEEFK